MFNPLLSSQTPRYDLLKPAHILPAIEKIIANNHILLKAIFIEAKNEPTWQNLIAPIEEINEQLNFVWSQVSHLNAVQHSADLDAVYTKALQKITLYRTELAQNQQFYSLVKKLLKSSEYKTLDYAQKKVVDNLMRDFRLSGAHLPNHDRLKLKSLEKKLNLLEHEFSNNVLLSTQEWHYLTDDVNELQGVPKHVITLLEQNARAKNVSGWLITLAEPIYRAIITYADSPSLRKKIYRAYTARASRLGVGSKRYNNDDVIVNILKLRKRIAELLGFHNYAELSLATKMARKPSAVNKFISELLSVTREKAKREFTELKRFTQKKFNVTDIKAWDIAYYAEKLLQEKHHLSSEEIRLYFPEDTVLNGLFIIANKLYGIKVKQRTGIPVWHKEVRYYDVYDKENKLSGGFYLDLYPRENKRSGAWMDEVKPRMKRLDGQLQLPIAQLICNLSRPINKQKPALFTHQEVETIFHEFGHVLQHVLSKVNYCGVSGIRGVPLDAVEFASQFMEHWCWQKKSLQIISKHYLTSHHLPPRLLNEMLKTQKFNLGLQALRQLEFAWFDLTLHLLPTRNITNRSITRLLAKIRKKTTFWQVPSFNYTQNSFLHIFSSGYAAGYYSYKWSEVMADDAFQKFLVEGIFNAKLGRFFVENILSQGGAVDPMEAFKKFRGRSLSLKPYLKQYKKTTTVK